MLLKYMIIHKFKACKEANMEMSCKRKRVRTLVAKIIETIPTQIKYSIQNTFINNKYMDNLQVK